MDEEEMEDETESDRVIFCMGGASMRVERGLMERYMSIDDSLQVSKVRWFHNRR